MLTSSIARKTRNECNRHKCLNENYLSTAQLEEEMIIIIIVSCRGSEKEMTAIQSTIRAVWNGRGWQLEPLKAKQSPVPSQFSLSLTSLRVSPPPSKRVVSSGILLPNHPPHPFLPRYELGLKLRSFFVRLEFYYFTIVSGYSKWSKSFERHQLRASKTTRVFRPVSVLDNFARIVESHREKILLLTHFKNGAICGR